MKKLSFLLIINISTTCLSFGQEIYFKASANYDISTINQQMPEYFTFQNIVPLSVGTVGYNINLAVNEFSISSGQNYHISTGYSFNDFFSFELKFSTFNNSKNKFKASPELKYARNGTTGWDLHSYSLSPTIAFSRTFNKSTVNLFVYSGLGYSKLLIKASIDEHFGEYKFDRSITFSWGYGLEYSYSITKKFGLFTNIGTNNRNYKPEKAELISSSYPLEQFAPHLKEIQYVNEINNLELGYNGSSDPARPEIRLKETLKLSSIYLGIGIKYILKK